MKYTCEIEINLPRKRVFQLFEDDDFMKVWIKGLKSMKLIEGKRYQTGAITEMVHEMNGKDVLMKETVLKREGLALYEALYEADNVKNWVINTFEDRGGRTLWKLDNIFEFTGFMRVFNFIGKKMFIKQTKKDLINFKEAAEAANR